MRESYEKEGVMTEGGYERWRERERLIWLQTSKEENNKRTWNIKHVISNLRAKFNLLIIYNHVCIK